MDHDPDLADRCWPPPCVVGYPTALFVGLFVRNKTLQTALLVLCVIPFWTSFLIRVLAWRPMLGKEGAINIILLQALHITQSADRGAAVHRTFGDHRHDANLLRVHGRSDRLHAGAHRSEHHRSGAGSRRQFLADLAHHHPSAERCRASWSARSSSRVMVLGEFATCVGAVRPQGQPARQHHRDPGRLAEMGVRRRSSASS